MPFLSLPSPFGRPKADATIAKDKLIDELNSIDARSFVSPTDRGQVRDALFRALRQVQTPFNIAYDQVWTDTTTTAVVKTLVDVGLWKRWAEAGHGPMSVVELAGLTAFDPVLLNRLLRCLAGQHLVVQAGPETYSPTAYSRALGDDKFTGLYPFRYEIIEPCLGNFPRFAAENQYQNPTDGPDTNFSHWRGKNETLFSVLRSKPELATNFDHAMALYSSSAPSWIDIYPTEEIVKSTSVKKPDEPRKLVVDVGGGSGHDLEKFRVKHPGVPHGSLVLQDQPLVVEAAILTAPCVAEAHDFFTPEPIKGARAYYIKNVLHNWPDDKAIEILKNIASAMEKGFSKILVHEIVIVDQGAHARATISDVLMMALLSSVERSERDWQNLISQAGLKVVKIWSISESVDSIIEIDLA